MATPYDACLNEAIAENIISEKQRDQFQKALDADPKFELEPAEAGHPIWGPALRSVKAERAKTKPK